MVSPPCCWMAASPISCAVCRRAPTPRCCWMRCCARRSAGRRGPDRRNRCRRRALIRHGKNAPRPLEASQPAQAGREGIQSSFARAKIRGESPRAPRRPQLSQSGRQYARRIEKILKHEIRQESTQETRRPQARRLQKGLAPRRRRHRAATGAGDLQGLPHLNARAVAWQPFGRGNPTRLRRMQSGEGSGQMREIPDIGAESF